MSWSSWKKKENTFGTVYFIWRNFFFNICIFMYSVMNTLSEYTYQKTSYTLLFAFKITESVQCILEVYCVKVVANIKPSYLNIYCLFENDICCLDKPCASCFMGIFIIRNKNCIFYLFETGFNEHWVLKILFSNHISFKEHVKIVKIQIINFNVTISDRLGVKLKMSPS